MIKHVRLLQKNQRPKHMAKLSGISKENLDKLKPIEDDLEFFQIIWTSSQLEMFHLTCNLSGFSIAKNINWKIS